MAENDEDHISIYEIRKPGDLLDPLIRTAKNLDAGYGKRGGVSELARRLKMPRPNVYPILRREKKKNADILLSTVLKLAEALGYTIWFSEPEKSRETEKCKDVGRE